MSGHGQKLNRKQEQALAALLLEPTIREAAQKAGVGEATLFRWLQLPGFQTAFRDAKRQSVEHAVSLLQKVAGEAVQTLRDVMNSSDSKDSARVMAAKAVIDFAIKGVELEDLAARVEALETAKEGA